MSGSTPWAGALLALGLVASGCSGETTTGSPCSGSSPPAGCGQACGAMTAPCPTGLYCAAGTCTADCIAATGGGCAAGQRCTVEGRCTGPMDGSTGGLDGSPPRFDGAPLDETCADVTLDTSHVTPNVILLVDRSGSMRNDFDMGMTRWEVLQNAILATPDGLVASLQHTVRFGLALYTGSDTMGTCPDMAFVLPPVLDNYAAIQATYTMFGPGSNTPTGESMSALVTRLGSTPLEPGPTIIVLATDGEPNTCADRMDRTGGQMMAEAAATAARAAGYTVHAIGVSTDVALANLTRVAEAGGGTAYSVTDTAGLVAALSTIVGGVVTCDIALSGMVNPATACSGTVTLGGRALGCEDPNGWHLVDASHIQLQGTACTELMSTGATVVARFPCDVVLF